jgi:hypothetical protein
VSGGYGTLASLELVHGDEPHEARASCVIASCAEQTILLQVYSE